jgi:hypothetical protein
MILIGLGGRSAKMIKKNENVLEPILKVIGTRSFANCLRPTCGMHCRGWPPCTQAPL